MLDHIDMSILQELSKNSRITMKELGEIVHLTSQATTSRVAKLVDNGVIEGYTIQVNQTKVGYIFAFINIYAKSTNHEPYLSFIRSNEKYAINNYKINGDSCYLLECRFPSNELLDQFLIDLNKHAYYKLSIVISKWT
jgi:Lrp/AsnC family leucine-responsive transcriptional regulator